MPAWIRVPAKGKPLLTQTGLMVPCRMDPRSNRLQICDASSEDQQQRLQGYMPIIVMHLYNNGAGLLPGANIPSGPGFVDKSNASSVAALAGVDR